MSPESSSDHIKMPGPQDDGKQGATIEARATDVESDRSADEILQLGERTELTPVEAFKWNVDGDQSPCGKHPAK
jgi:hypothetical protein